MSARDKNRKPPHSLVILVFLILLVSAYATRPLVPSTREDHTGDEDRCPYTEYDVRSDGDGGFSFAIKRDDESCAEYGQASAETKDRNDAILTLSEADLLAQERMAHWTLWIGILTGAGLIVLYITFVATRDAVEETRNIGVAQTRAYLAGLSAVYITERGKPYAIELTIKNFGNSPAKIERLLAEYQFDLLCRRADGDANTGIIIQRATARKVDTISAGAEAVIQLHPWYTLHEKRDFPFSDDIFSLSVEVGICYQDVFEKKTDITVDVSEKGDAQMGSPRTKQLKVTTSEGRRLKTPIEVAFENVKTAFRETKG